MRKSGAEELTTERRSKEEGVYIKLSSKMSISWKLFFPQILCCYGD